MKAWKDQVNLIGECHVRNSKLISNSSLVFVHLGNNKTHSH